MDRHRRRGDQGPGDLPQAAQPALIEREIPVTFKASSFFLAEWDATEQEAMKAAGIPFQVVLPDVTPDTTLYLFELHDGEEPPSPGVRCTGRAVTSCSR
jgi:hypothetical protein